MIQPSHHFFQRVELERGGPDFLVCVRLNRLRKRREPLVEQSLESKAGKRVEGEQRDQSQAEQTAEADQDDVVRANAIGLPDQGQSEERPAEYPREQDRRREHQDRKW